MLFLNACVYHTTRAFYMIKPPVFIDTSQQFRLAHKLELLSYLVSLYVHLSRLYQGLMFTAVLFDTLLLIRSNGYSF